MSARAENAQVIWTRPLCRRDIAAALNEAFAALIEAGVDD